MSQSVRSFTIYCPAAVKSLWPEPLADQWLGQYGEIFDADDLRLSKSQPRNHFAEWFTAIHIYHTHGALSLVEKYFSKPHARKTKIASELIRGKRYEILCKICEDCAVQAPDLLVYHRDYGRFWFAEVKGPGDSLSDKQIESHSQISARLGVEVEVYSVKLVAGPRPNTG